MIRCILVATDGSDASLAAVHAAIDLVQSLGSGAELHAGAAINYAELPSVLAKQPPGAPDLLAAQAEAALAAAASAGRAAGLDVKTHLLTGDVVEAIRSCAATIGADMLVAGYQGRNRLARLVMGSVVGSLVRSADLPVLVVRLRS
jgi:nucleotide-binding universal stress UspA family protein